MQFVVLQRPSRAPSSAPQGTSALSLTLQLDDERERRLTELARTLNVDATSLAKAAIDDLMSRPMDDFERAARYVLNKNADLYRRLA